MAHYEQALKQLRYRNWRPATLSERRFRLTCSELNGRYTSNEFNLEVWAMSFKHIIRTLPPLFSAHPILVISQNYFSMPPLCLFICFL